MAKLSEKHKEFARNLILHKFNRTKAYMATYPDANKDSARTNAPRLLANDDVNEYVQTLVEEEEAKTLITVEEVIDGIKEVVKYAEKDNDKLKGYDLLGKYLKLWTEKHELSGTDGKPIENKISIVFEE